MIKWQEFKQALVNKLQAEGSSFTARDIIKDRDIKGGFKFHIKEYDHLAWTITAEEEKDDWFATRYGRYMVTWREFYRDYPEEAETSYCDWTNDPHRAFLSGALHIGYTIGNTY